jgi:uncharacterized integral membrane protein
LTAPTDSSTAGTAQRSNENGPVRLLVVAGETLSEPAVLERIRGLVGDREASAWVVAPALTSSPIKHATGEVDDDIEAARRRLKESQEALRSVGIEARGEVGDSDPSMALEDALRRFPADQVVVAARAGEEARWLESDLLEKTPDDVRRPVTRIVVEDADQGRVHVEHGRRERDGRTAGEPGQEDVTVYGLPRMPPRYWAAIAVGALGVVVLFVLALLCQNDSPVSSDLPFGCAVRFGLLLAAFIVTVLHGVGLLLLGSAGYEGRWGKVTADSLLWGIPPAVVVSAIAGAVWS